MKKLIIIILICIILIVSGITIYLSCNYSRDLVDVNSIETDSNFKDIVYDKEGNVLDIDILGVLEIEKIGLKAPVKEGTTSDILREYIGHIEDTSIYDGNICLSAHNRGYKNSYFARINELEEGDILIYKTKYYTRKYKVDKITTIYESDWSLLNNTEQNKLTLITCVPNIKNQRLCIQAVGITEKDLQEEDYRVIIQQGSVIENE